KRAPKPPPGSRPAQCCIRRWRRRSAESTPTNFPKWSLSRSPMRSAPISTGSAPKRAASAIALVACVLSCAMHVRAADTALPGAEPKLLPAEQAFRFSARALSPQLVEARFDVANGYYLYREKLRFAADGAQAGAAELPAGKFKHDEFFGDVETYRGTLLVKLPLTNGAPGQSVVLKADSQGCADV